MKSPRWLNEKKKKKRTAQRPLSDGGRQEKKKRKKKENREDKRNANFEEPTQCAQPRRSQGRKKAKERRGGDKKRASGIGIEILPGALASSVKFTRARALPGQDVLVSISSPIPIYKKRTRWVEKVVQKKGKKLAGFIWSIEKAHGPPSRRLEERNFVGDMKMGRPGCRAKFAGRGKKKKGKKEREKTKKVTASYSNRDL